MGLLGEGAIVTIDTIDTMGWRSGSALGAPALSLDCGIGIAFAGGPTRDFRGDKVHRSA